MTNRVIRMRKKESKVRLCAKEICCGCGACMQKCPKQCITMVLDKEGFQYPRIDRKQCINCNKCFFACPIINNISLDDEEKKIYAAFALDDRIRMKSSSGGIFSLIAVDVLRQGGVIFGAAFDSKWRVHHITVTEEKDLSKIRGSKYLQSSIDNTYIEAETFLKQGRKILFSGTGCQIAGLKQFLGKDYPNCYTVDILCHGVPSPLVWEKYIYEKERVANNCAKEIFFRNKQQGWNAYGTSILFNDDREYFKRHNEDIYMRLFLNNIDLRPSCHGCKFKSVGRISDITLGDAWGIEKVNSAFNDDKGTSLVIVQSRKGQELLDAIQDRVFIEEGNIDELLPIQSDARNSVKKHANREQFFNNLNKVEGIECMEKYLHFSISRRVMLKIKRSIKRM